MKTAANYTLALVTAPDLRTARKLAKVALEARLVACANLIPKVESLYWWEGKLEKSAEILLVLKTDRRRLGELEKLILAHHPYDTAEFITLNLSGGTERYLKWITDSICR